MNSNSKNKIFEGSSKILFESNEESTAIMFFKDSLNINSKILNIPNKGIINNRISEFLMSKLSSLGIKNHFIRRLNMREQLVRSLDMFPFYVVVRNVPSQEASNSLGFDPNTIISNPIVEYCTDFHYSNRYFLNHNHLKNFDIANSVDVKKIEGLALRINDILQGYFSAINLQMEYITLKFGKLYDDETMKNYSILLGDEITIESCSLIDSEVEIIFDHNTLEESNLLQIYQLFAKRLNISRPASKNL